MGKRYIDIELDSKVIATIGFNFLEKQYYVTNKAEVSETTVYRQEVDDALQVLLSMGITKINDIDIESGEPKVVVMKGRDNVEIPSISQEAIDYVLGTIYNPLETIEKFYYTMEDDGSYVRTISFNNWTEYPLEVDCSKGNIFIRNTDILYSLDVNENEIPRIQRIMSYYRDILGLDIAYYSTSPEDPVDEYGYIRAIYYFLTKQYTEPHFYNEIIKEDNTEELVYNNIFKIANFNKASHVDCICTRDPYSESPNPKEISTIVSVDNSSNIIRYHLPVDVPAGQSYYDNLRINNKVIIGDSSYVRDETNFSADGVYTIDSLDKENGVIGILEPLGASWESPTCYVRRYSSNISKMSREDNTITLVDNVPDTLLVGSKIRVEGAYVSDEVNCDGEYTISNIQNKVISVEESIPTNFTSSSQHQAILYQEILIGSVVKINYNGAENSSLVTSFSLDNLQTTVEVRDTLNLHNTSGLVRSCSCSGIAESTFTIPLSEGINKEFISLAVLYFADPSETIEVNVTSIDEVLENHVSLGEFALDNFEACQKFIKTLWFVDYEVTQTYSNIPKLDEDVDKNLYQRIQRSYDIDEQNSANLTIDFKDLYSEVYGKSE